MNLVPLLKLQVTSETQRKDASREDGGWEPGRMRLESLLLSSVSWRKSFHLSRPQFPQLEGDSHDLYMTVVMRVKWGVLRGPAEGLACRSSIYFMEWQVTGQDLAGGEQECVYPGTACHCWMHQAGVTSVHWASYAPCFLPWALLQSTLLPAWSNASRRLAKCPTVPTNLKTQREDHSCFEENTARQGWAGQQSSPGLWSLSLPPPAIMIGTMWGKGVGQEWVESM